MKKILATAVALGMVAGLAASASAMELKVTGKYVADGYYFNQGNGAASGGGVLPWDDKSYRTLVESGVVTGGTNDSPGADDWYQHTFRINPRLIVNDKVQVKADIRLIDSNTVWGSQGDLNTDNGGNMKVRKLWLVYDSPIGRWEVGRRPAGSWMSDFLNTGTAGDQILFRPNMPDHFKAYAFLQKDEERDGYWNNLDSNDADYYEAGAGYSDKALTAWLGLGTKIDNTNDVAGGSATQMSHVMGYGQYGINGNLTALAELDYKWGTTDFNTPGVPDQDTSAWAYYGALAGNFGNLSTTLGFAHIDGDSNPTATDDNAYDPKYGLGADFEPLYILTGSTANILNGDRGANVIGDAVRRAGVNAPVLLADFKTTDKLTLHGGVGAGWADDEPSGYDNAYGYEFDLGAAYQLYKNLTYSVNFGYWAVGDFVKRGDPDIGSQDIYLVSHHLSMKF